MIIDEYYSLEDRTFENHSRIESNVLEMHDIEFQQFIQRIKELDIDIEDSPKYSNVDQHPTLENMTFIYIVSNNIYSEKNMFKIGKHKGTKKMLIKRYKTYLIDPIVYFFFPTGNVSQDESNLLQRFSNYRVSNSEFLNIKLEDLIFKVKFYFKNKYQRNPCVQMKYYRCFFKQNMYDFFDKTIQFKKCIFTPHFDVGNSSPRKIEFIYEQKMIFELDLLKIQHILKDYVLLQFDKKNNILYLDEFMDHGLNDLFIEIMKNIYSYSSYKILTRREFIQKESFPERLILIKKSEEPIEIIVEKMEYLHCCMIVEDQNIYSLENQSISFINFDQLFYYYFYTL